MAKQRKKTVTGRVLHDPVKDKLRPMYPLDLSKCRTVDELVRAMGNTAFTGRQVGDAADIVELMARRKPEVVFHLAAQADVRVSVARPVRRCISARSRRRCWRPRNTRSCSCRADADLLIPIPRMEVQRIVNIIFDQHGETMLGRSSIRRVPSPRTSRRRRIVPLARMSLDFCGGGPSGRSEWSKRAICLSRGTSGSNPFAPAKSQLRTGLPAGQARGP